MAIYQRILTTCFNPAYYGASGSNPIVMQAVTTNMLTNTMSSALFQYPAGLAYFDADGDGKGDLAFTGVDSGGKGITGIFENTGIGAGSFMFSNSPYSLPRKTARKERHLVISTATGVLDIVVANTNGMVSVYRNLSTGRRGWR